ncbi:MAG: TVP38/TMEM64 family protein [Actinomycetota bacterium]|nr:TVP38/TMEM64 family protein [Actinomycetota bacterium]MDP9475029.1 TVP38/TMEM64 family protein [Actinomycetota bacterium]
MDPRAGRANKRKGAGKLIAGAGALLLALLVARLTGVTEYISLDGLNSLRGWINGFGVVAPIVFIVVYVVATVAFLPGAPLSLLAGLVFGAVWGTLWTVIGATLGATLAFLIGRYAARGLVESWTADNPRIRKLDEGVEKHGWRMLLITRLVPLFPFNLQNYAYGLTRIGIGTYVLLTGTCIVPGVLVYTFAGGSLASARENLTRTFAYLGVAAVVFVLISLIPGWLGKRIGR